MLPKLRCPDLLSDRIASRLVTTIQNNTVSCSTNNNNNHFWLTLIAQSLQRLPCIVVDSGLFSNSYYASLPIQDNQRCVELIDTDHLQDGQSLFDRIENRLVTNTASSSPRPQQQQVYLFIANLTSLLSADSPDNESDFVASASACIGRLWTLTRRSPSIRRLYLNFTPVKSLEGGRHNVAYTSDLLDLLGLHSDTLITYDHDRAQPTSDLLLEYQLDLWHRRANGDDLIDSRNKPAIAEHLLVTIDNYRFVKFIQLNEKVANPTTTAEDKADEQLQSIASFNLQLSESERLARSRVALPYEKQQPTPGVQIHYVPDCFDDLDDDDPDDDLDF